MESAMPNALDESKALLVRRWGELGSYWGVNRTMAEIHALLFVSHDALCTDDIMEELKISRGNASMNVRGLVDWGLIRRVHKLGDRKEYYEADYDVWYMFETIMRERRRREIDPVIETIDHCRTIIEGPNADLQGVPARAVQRHRRQLEELRDFLTTMSTLFDLVLRYGRSGIGRLVRSIAAAAIDASPPRRRAAGKSTRQARGPKGEPR